MVPSLKIAADFGEDVLRFEELCAAGLHHVNFFKLCSELLRIRSMGMLSFEPVNSVVHAVIVSPGFAETLHLLCAYVVGDVVLLIAPLSLVGVVLLILQPGMGTKPIGFHTKVKKHSKHFLRYKETFHHLKFLLGQCTSLNFLVKQHRIFVIHSEIYNSMNSLCSIQFQRLRWYTKYDNCVLQCKMHRR